MLVQREAEVNAGRKREAELDDTIRAGRDELVQIEAGNFGDPRAHLKHDHHPVPPELTRQGRFVELWAAISISVVIIAVLSLTYTGVMRWWVALIVGIVTYAILEAAFRRRVTVLVLRATLFLAAIGALILAYEFAGILLIAALGGLAVLTFADNVREIRRG